VNILGWTNWEYLHIYYNLIDKEKGKYPLWYIYITSWISISKSLTTCWNFKSRHSKASHLSKRLLNSYVPYIQQFNTRPISQNCIQFNGVQSLLCNCHLLNHVLKQKSLFLDENLWLNFIWNCQNINVTCNMTNWNIWNKAKPQATQTR